MTPRILTALNKPIIAIIFCSLCFLQHASAQKKFSVTIVADSSIDFNGLHCQYYNGFDQVFVPDTFTGNTITLTDEFISKFVSFDVSYNNGDYQGAYTFFVDEKPAIIHIRSVKDKGESNLQYSNLENATDIYDTTTNLLLKELRIFQKEENEGLSKLWTNNNSSDIWHNDSLRAINDNLQSKRTEKTILFLKNHPNEYFSFWYFQDLVGGYLLQSEKDTAYLRRFVTRMNEIFTASVVNGAEGQWLIVRINAALYPPLQAGDQVPNVTLKDINGKSVSLSDFKGNYFLLDFWASWCPPCRKNGAALKAIAAQYKKNGLRVVGISIDNNLNKWKEAIKEDGLNWVNLSDANLGNNSAAMHYKITSVPHYFLVNPFGTLVLEASNLQAIQNHLLRLFPR